MVCAYFVVPARFVVGSETDWSIIGTEQTVSRIVGCESEMMMPLPPPNLARIDRRHRAHAHGPPPRALEITATPL
jgi:hypothetical protein